MRGGEIITCIRNNSSSNRESGEEKHENGTTTTPPTPTKTTRTRIFVGDLGGTVTAEDLRNTFSSLGKVESVEIVRSQGRSFAYFDFLPSSPKSLSKLFSMYNGCKWKGGKLRLEKAKEHYLLRLRHEQAEDVKLANSEPSCTASQNTGPPEELNTTLNPEKMEVRLFFPKLRKVKALPFKGTGKHKYSFQRVQPPILPIHFCDCEEHSDPSHSAKGKHVLELEAHGGGLDKKELDMMKSAMNNLFEREYIPNTARKGAGFVNEGYNTKSVDDLVSDENETYDVTGNDAQSVDDLVGGENETDNMIDEDLIINMVAGGKQETDLLCSWGQEVILANEGKLVDELQASIDRPSGHVLKSHERKIVASDKKRKSPLTEQARERKGSAKKAHLHESAQAIGLESGTQSTNTNHSQKFAWRDLVSNNNSFSISHILQSTTPNKPQSKSNCVNVSHIAERQDQNMVKNINLEYESNWIEKNKEHGVAQPSKPNEAATKSGRGASWLQKSSWTQLVSEKNTSFSISQLFPSATLEKQEQVELKRTANSTGTTYCKFVKSGIRASTENSSKALGVGNKDILTAPDSSNMVALDTVLDSAPTPPPQNLQTLGESDEMTPPKRNHAAAEQPSFRNFTTRGTCSFMRSAASMREWRNAKAALSGSLKKQNNEK